MRFLRLIAYEFFCIVKYMVKPTVGIVGLGMVGEPLKCYFETKGFKRGKNLLCYDTDPRKKCLDDISKADIIFVCVPTPSKKDGSCDTSIVESIVKNHTRSAQIIVIKSTVPPNTAELLAKKYERPIIFSPEFLTEANSWKNTIHPDRQIVAPTAGAKKHALRVLSLLPQAPFCTPKHKKAKVSCDISPTEAELGKYAANTFGALKVTFGNIVYDFSKALEATLQKKGIKSKVNYDNVRQILAHDSRITDSWLDVGHGKYRGYGGYCFPKDSDALIASMKKILKENSTRTKESVLLHHGVALLDAMRRYNHVLLDSQGLNLYSVSRHEKDIKIPKKTRTKKP